MPSNQWNKVMKLTDYITSTWNPKMKWMWGEALFGYALVLVDDYQQTNNYTPFLKGYCDYYLANPPRIDQSDTVAPALITYQMQKKFPQSGYEVLTNRALHYIQHEPRLIEDSVNHLGNSLEGKLYPKSIWVDSLMMFSVFPSIYAKEQEHPDMMNIALRQPRIMAKYMMDPIDHLWYHCYWVKQKTHYPKKKIYWGRGNGWVICSLPMILEQAPQHEERAHIITLLQDTSKALLPYQRADGTFETVFNKVGKTYRELSFTALVAAGWLKGIRLGVLEEAIYLEPAKKAYFAVVDAIEQNDQELAMPEISGPTIPVPLFPYLGYKFVPRGKNWSYGLAALLFAAIEYEKHLEKKK
ncbi:MAG: glycoside hydrolase family 88 protein [Candidatus Izemoplasmatales bacterium]|nr:glycoside hydrolase family 88 protein [bacterium]MDZ4197387.1 glycoside hydrolase family 88 protein [Candidatus Izemoplasmatales bacterium]